MESPVVLGLRPAAFSVAGPDAGAAVAVVPLGVESLGDEKHVLFPALRSDEAPASTSVTDADGVPVAVDETAAAQLWTAKVGQRTDLAIGRPVSLAIDLSEAYFFDVVSGEAITDTDRAGAAGRRTGLKSRNCGPTGRVPGVAGTSALPGPGTRI
jgi:multiple sugar transport system ATP-binding protein